MSQVPGIATNVALLTQHILNNGGSAGSPTAATGWTDWQSQAMNHYAEIQRNTYDAAVRCERAAIACETMVTQLRRVIVPKGTTAAYGVNVYLKN